MRKRRARRIWLVPKILRFKDCAELYVTRVSSGAGKIPVIGAERQRVEDSEGRISDGICTETSISEEFYREFVREARRNSERYGYDLLPRCLRG